MPRRLVSFAAIAVLIAVAPSHPRAQSAASSAVMPLTVDASCAARRWSAIRRRICGGRVTVARCISSGGCRARTSPQPGRSAATAAHRAACPTTNGAWRHWPTAGGTDRGGGCSASTAATSSSSTPGRGNASTSPGPAPPNRHRAGPAAARTSPSSATTTCSSCRSPTPAAAAWCSSSMRRRGRPTQLTDSQRTARKEEQGLIDWVAQAAARRQRREAKEQAHALLRFDLVERQRVVDARVGKRRRVSVARGRRRDAAVAHGPGPAVRVRIGVHRGDRRSHQGRRRPGGPAAGGAGSQVGRRGVGRRHRRRRQSEEGAAAGATQRRVDAGGPGRCRQPERRRRSRARSAGPRSLPSPDGRHARGVGAGRRQHRSLAGPGRPGHRPATVLDHVHDEAWVRDVAQNGSFGGGIGWLPDNAGCGSWPSTTVGCSSPPWTSPATRRNEWPSRRAVSRSMPSR